MNARRANVHQDMKYRCLYLAVLILDMIGTVVVSIVTLFSIFYVEKVVSIANERINSTESTTSTATKYQFGHNLDMELTQEQLWAIRMVLIVILILVIVRQHFGWKGFFNYHFVSTIIFAMFQSVAIIFNLVAVCIEFYFESLLALILSTIMTIVPIFYAFEIQKHN